MNSEKKYRVLELYSGIGGMRYALEASGILFEVVTAIDLNPIVNEIYQYNFGKDKHFQRNLCSLSAKEIEDMQIDIITMSPPCQPFTRVGLKRDTEDARSNSFLHILNTLVQLQRKPSFIIIENVQGFENSQAQKVLIQTLQQCKFVFREFLISPQNFGIPNSRLRYYLVAKHDPQSFVIEDQKITEIPNFSSHWRSVCTNCLKNLNNGFDSVCSVKHFLEEEPLEYFYQYLIPDHVLLKYWTVFDIVNENSPNCCCFTKAYSHYAQGTGSIFVPTADTEKVDEIFKLVANSKNDEIRLELLRSLKLRYFTPKEVSNIMCFPKSFDFPSHITRKQRYRSLGNSLNIFVLTCLIKSLFQNKLFR